jgi:hypothetical protein
MFRAPAVVDIGGRSMLRLVARKGAVVLALQGGLEGEVVANEAQAVCSGERQEKASATMVSNGRERFVRGRGGKP